VKLRLGGRVGPRSPRTVALVGGLLVLVVVAVASAARMLQGGPARAAAGPAPRFSEVTSSSGVLHTYGGPFVYAVGGGVAVFDCDGDGRQDVFLAGGEHPAALYRNASMPGSIRFTPVASPVTDMTAVNGAYPVDIDSDGQVDLVLLRYGGNVALRGLGGCNFEPANEAWGIDDPRHLTEAFSATWERGQAWPTIAFGNYADPAIKDFNVWCSANQLLRPAGTTGFAPPELLLPSYCALSMLFSDWDGNGRRDLRVSNDVHYYDPDLGEEQLWQIEPGQRPTLYTADDGWATVHVEGMGIATYDVDGDGRPEVYLTSQSASKLQALDPRVGGTLPSYVDIGLARKVNVSHPFTGSDMDLPSTAWHPEFADVNDDGFVDLLVTKGNVTSQPDYALEDPSNLLLGQPDGTFKEAADVAGIVTFDRGRGAALADFDLDGRLDLIEVFYDAPVRIWHNAGPADAADAFQAHWLAVRVRQPAPNVDAIGGWLEVMAGDTVWRRELAVGGGHAGGQLGWIHVGLGSATHARVRVRWPDGEVGPWLATEVDRFVIVDRAAGSIEPWTPPAP
jgi:enediyne biosynthesis protein E4